MSMTPEQRLRKIKRIVDQPCQWEEGDTVCLTCDQLRDVIRLATLPPSRTRGVKAWIEPWTEIEYGGRNYAVASIWKQKVVQATPVTILIPKRKEKKS